MEHKEFKRPVTGKEVQEEIKFLDEVFTTEEQEAIVKINETLEENTTHEILRGIEWIDERMIIYSIKHQFTANNITYSGIILEQKNRELNESKFYFVGNAKLVPTIVANLVNKEMQMKY